MTCAFELEPNVGIRVFELGFLIKMLAHCIFVVRLKAYHVMELEPNNRKCDVACVGIGVFELGFLIKMLVYCLFVVRLEAHHTFGI